MPQNSFLCKAELRWSMNVFNAIETTDYGNTELSTIDRNRGLVTSSELVFQKSQVS